MQLELSDADGRRSEAPRPKPALKAPVGDINRWLVLTAAGDKRAFRALYEATSSRMLSHAIYVLRRRDAAEDALQDAYLRIWSKAADYDPLKGAALPWMLRILRNVVIDRIRRDKAACNFVDIDDTTEELAAPVTPIDARIDLTNGLSRLSVEHRTSIVAVVVEGWTHDEAGARAGLPTPTSKARVLRGLKRLRHFQEHQVAPICATATGAR